MNLILWLLHLPRYATAQVLALIAAHVQWTSLAIEGLASAILDIANWLADVTIEPVDDDYDGWTFPDDDDSGLA